MAHHRPVTMSAARRKIVKERGAEPSELEESVAQVRAWSPSFWWGAVGRLAGPAADGGPGEEKGSADAPLPLYHSASISSLQNQKKQQGSKPHKLSPSTLSGSV